MQSSVTPKAPNSVSVRLWSFSVTRARKPAWLFGFCGFASVRLYFPNFGKMNEYTGDNGWRSRNAGNSSYAYRNALADLTDAQTQAGETHCSAMRNTARVRSASHRRTDAQTCGAEEMSSRDRNLGHKKGGNDNAAPPKRDDGTALPIIDASPITDQQQQTSGAAPGGGNGENNGHRQQRL